MNSEKRVSSTSSSGVSESNKGSTMERNSLMSSSNKMIMVTDEQKQAYNNNNNNNNVGYSWPPRSYACSFCKREFRSAQALGGHMNVHRRDRARLRLHYSPPLSPHHHQMLNLNVSPNPNPNPKSPSPSTLTASVLPCKWVSNDDPLPSSSTKDCKFGNTTSTLGLSLQIGHSKEDLDLELRLGYP